MTSIESRVVRMLGNHSTTELSLQDWLCCCYLFASETESSNFVIRLSGNLPWDLQYFLLSLSPGTPGMIYHIWLNCPLMLGSGFISLNMVKEFWKVTLHLTLWYFVNSISASTQCQHFTWESSSNITQRTSCFVLSTGNVGPEEVGWGVDTQQMACVTDVIYSKSNNRCRQGFIGYLDDSSRIKDEASLGWT